MPCAPKRSQSNATFNKLGLLLPLALRIVATLLIFTLNLVIFLQVLLRKLGIFANNESCSDFSYLQRKSDFPLLVHLVCITFAYAKANRTLTETKHSPGLFTLFIIQPTA